MKAQILFLGLMMLSLIGCRIEEDISVSNPSEFDYNFQLFNMDYPSDTLQVGQWYRYELYIKPSETNTKKVYSHEIVLSPVITTGKRGSYQLFTLSGDSLTGIKRFGDKVKILSDSLQNNRIILKQRIEMPNASGSVVQTTTLWWNTIEKSMVTNLYVK
ncbi:hypothetical protein [Cellulophaga sp. BC115SP]|uniref:hypothetical protein n=1 Tax=Cellulophaga sp. BC115SP TaxID=2683263 RepID=UPI001412F703|nr:hypothetical protein [Cellulophaga sp. BC115SP]NBB29926.1 hypothetical protein [Cellulophaga sp. BC115SP]